MMNHKISPSSRTWAAKVASPQKWQADVDLIFGPFSEFLHKQGYAKHSIYTYQRAVVRAAKQLANRGARLTGLTRSNLAALIREMLGPGASVATGLNIRAAMRRWLKFNGTFEQKPNVAWMRWVDDYESFLIAHRGLAPTTLALSRYFLYDYLTWQFGSKAADWSAVRPKDLWSYAADHSRRVKPATVNRGGSVLRAFFHYLHLRGNCSQTLTKAVPLVANFAATYHPGVLTAVQRSRLLAVSKKHHLEGTRDFAIVLCMVDLGLRCIEAASLRLANLDFSRGILTVPAVKGVIERQLPLPAHIAAALRIYVERDRPAGQSDVLFLRHFRRRGQPVSPILLTSLIKRLYGKCGFPSGWSGPHRLRHTFATRLFDRGASLKEIADCLGHCRLETSRGYTHVDLNGLRLLARPWPR